MTEYGLAPGMFCLSQKSFGGLGSSRHYFWGGEKGQPEIHMCLPAT